MQDAVIVILAGIFLPLFPMSMIFNWLFDRCVNTTLRVALLFVWPLTGVAIVAKFNLQLLDWVLWASLLTSALYAFRVLSLREVNQWTGFMATSLWSLLWLLVLPDTPVTLLYAYTVAMAVPLAFLITLSGGLERRFGAAYAGLYGGLARTIPRFSGVLVLVIISATATPLFPSFFIMLHLVVKTVPSRPMEAIVLLLIWLLWSWAGARLIQGLIVGRASEVKIADFSKATTTLYAVLLIGLIFVGAYLAGVVL